MNVSKPSTRIFKTKWFCRWARKHDLTDALLEEAVLEIESGLIDAQLGGSIIKKRIGGRGEGKRGGFRTILAFREGDRCFFVYGFAKNDKENINTRELIALKLLGRELMKYSNSELSQAAASGELEEIERNG